MVPGAECLPSSSPSLERVLSPGSLGAFPEAAGGVLGPWGAPSWRAPAMKLGTAADEPQASARKPEIDAEAREAASGGRRMGKLRGLGPLLLILGLALWELVAALGPRGLVTEDVRQATALVRAELKPGELVTVAPEWIEPMVRRELGDLMPASMLGRADAGRYGRIWELSFAGKHAEDVQGLAAERVQRFGGVTVSRYPHEAVAVSLDLTERLPEARVTMALGAQAEKPCYWVGVAAGGLPQRGPAGAFRCERGSVELRTAEVDYRPRRAMVVEVGELTRTALVFEGIPDTAWRGGKLVLWLGHHDYHRRKTALGPSSVVVDLDRGAARVPIQVEVKQGFRPTEIPLPQGTTTAGAGTEHSIRIEISSAKPKDHLVALHGEIRPQLQLESKR